MRKARKLAEQRQRAWDEIRSQQEIDRGNGAPHSQTGHTGTTGQGRPPLIHAPVGHTPLVHTPVPTATGVAYPDQLGAHQAGAQPAPMHAADPAPVHRRSVAPALLAVLEPVTLSFALVLLLVAGSPLVTGSWNIAWLAGSSGAAIALLLLYPGAIRGAGRGARTAGLVLAGLVTVSAVAGIVGQNVVEGRAQVRGSATDRAVEEQRELAAAVDVLSENQGLLNLPPQQAIPLGAVYAEARQQAILIGERWNPATNGTPPLPELAEAYALVNLAAAQQAAAIDGFVANLENPEPALEAEYVERGIAVDAILTRDLPPVLEAVERAIRNSVTGEDKP
jgi:hypothetical protein